MITLGAHVRGPKVILELTPSRQLRHHHATSGFFELAIPLADAIAAAHETASCNDRLHALLVTAFEFGMVR